MTRRVWIAIGVVVGAIVLLNLLAQGLDRAVGGSDPTGVPGSSYATADGGLAAYTSLLARYDHPIERTRGPLATQALDPRSTIFVVQPTELTRDDTDALLEFVSEGGRLVVGGTEPFYMRDLRDHPPTWSSDNTTYWSNADPALGPARNILTAGGGSFSDPGSGRVVVGQPENSLVTVDRVGRGEIYFLADSSVLSNGYLGEADNASFALALAGAPGRPVAFAEGVHGYGRERGWRAIPHQWKIALLFLAIAAIVYVWSRARRFGAPDRNARTLPPPRSDYVRALATTLERTHDSAHALAPAQAWAREQVETRAGLPTDATNDAVVKAAHDLGCPDDEVSTLLGPVNDEPGAVALARLVARVSTTTRRNE
jgi:hypothetical protein